MPGTDWLVSGQVCIYGECIGLLIPSQGGYVALSKIEAETIHGDVSVDGGSYFVVPHVRHSLHCVNYLRKVAYEKWYPTIRHEDKPTVPTFWQHVGQSVSNSKLSRPHS